MFLPDTFILCDITNGSHSKINLSSLEKFVVCQIASNLYYKMPPCQKKIILCYPNILIPEVPHFSGNHPARSIPGAPLSR